MNQRLRPVHILASVLFLAGWLGFCLATVEAGPTPADLVFVHGAVYTVDAGRTQASALAVAGNRIVYVGTDEGARAFLGPKTRVIDLHGRMVLPGKGKARAAPSAVPTYCG